MDFNPNSVIDFSIRLWMSAFKFGGPSIPSGKWKCPSHNGVFGSYKLSGSRTSDSSWLCALFCFFNISFFFKKRASTSPFIYECLWDTQGEIKNARKMVAEPRSICSSSSPLGGGQARAGPSPVNMRACNSQRNKHASE